MSNQVKKWMRRILLLICVSVFIYSAYNLVTIYLDYKNIDDSYDKITEEYVKEPTDDTKDKEEAYLQLDWQALTQRNKDVKAWIEIPDTNVNYPVMQGESNETYIHSDIDKKSFRAGSIFIASENKDPFNDLNTVIYGHNMKNGSMFNNIKSYTDQDFTNKHPYVYIYLSDGTVSKYLVVSGHIIPETSELYNSQVTDLQDFYTKMLKTSNISVDFDKTQNQPVITLSTCTSGGSENGKRNVVHAVLVQKGINPLTEKRIMKS